MKTSDRALGVQNQTYWAQAGTNIALIKYWGKRDEVLKLPFNSSLSITLDRFYTQMGVTLDETLPYDQVFINGTQADQEKGQRLVNFLNLVRDLSGIRSRVRVESLSHVPIGAGFASSASAFAALAGAVNEAFKLGLTLKEVTMLARQGSGSAARSIYGGFNVWHKGERTDGTDSYGEQILEAKAWPLCILSVVVSTKQKEISSSEGMKRTVLTSPLYEAWLKQVPKDFQMALRAIENRDFEALGNLIEANAMLMHATMLGARPPILYMNESTLSIWSCVQNLRKAGYMVYATIDAGPNLKLLTRECDREQIEKSLMAMECVKEIMVCRPGKGLILL